MVIRYPFVDIGVDTVVPWRVAIRGEIEPRLDLYFAVDFINTFRYLFFVAGTFAHVM